MKQYRNLILLLLLVASLVAVNLYRKPSSTPSPLQPTRASNARPGRGAPAAIPDAELHLAKLSPEGRTRAADIRRNIFEYGSQPAVARPRALQAATTTEQPAPPPPPPPPPLRFYGFAEGSRGGPRRVLLTDGEGVFVARQGDTIAGRYRVLAVTERSVELEEVAGERRWVIPLEMP